MPTCASTLRNSTRILFLESTIPRGEFIKQLADMVFTQSNLMFKHVGENIIYCDKFILIIPYDELVNLLDDPVFQFEQVQLVHVYCGDGTDLKNYLIDNIEHLHKLRFCHQWQLESILKKLKADNVVDSQGSNYLPRLKDIVSTFKSNIVQKRSSSFSAESPKPKRLHMDNYLSGYFCSACTSLLRQPYQLTCSHRICKPCINNDNEYVACPFFLFLLMIILIFSQTECRTCSIVSMNVQVCDKLYLN